MNNLNYTCQEKSFLMGCVSILTFFFDDYIVYKSSVTTVETILLCNSALFESQFAQEASLCLHLTGRGKP
jgi:hypothetical protein